MDITSSQNLKALSSKRPHPWMVLGSKNRGTLEKEIDNTINAIPIFVKKYRDITMKARLQYRDETRASDYYYS
jgi:hypothetical protein